jgi:Pro-kumamolisin, activation domain
MTRKILLGFWCLLLLVFIASSGLSSYAQGAQPRITQQIDERAYVTLTGNTRPEANVLNYRGPVSAVFPVDHILLFLQRSPQQEQAVDKYINSLNDKNSPNFHKWLTPEEYGERYGVAEEDIQQVTNWLQSQGFVINRVYTNRMVIDFSGTAGQISDAFHTQIGQLEVGGEAHIANMSDPQIPAALAPVIKGIFSLNNFRPHAMNKPVSQYTFAGCTSSSTNPTEPGTCYAVTPQDTQTIYNLTPLYGTGISGQGQTIALMEDTDTYGGAADWNSYRNAFGLTANFPSGTYTQVHPGCSDPGTNGDDGEAAIDVEVASSVAPSAAIELVSCPSGTVTFGGLIALQNLINAAGPYPGVVSVSYGVCEAFNGNGGNAAFYNTYQQAASQGISVFVSSGDEGSSSCSSDFGISTYDVTSLGVTGWGASPYNVSVGGTDFEDTYNSKTGGLPVSTYWNSTNSSGYGSAKQYVPEIPWNDACASTLISEVGHGNFTTYGTAGFCNVVPGNTTYLSTGAGSGGASNCATGAGGVNTGEYGISEPECQGWAKPSYQTGAVLTGGKAVYGQPSDGLRDIPDVSLFAANGVWGHYEVVCWSDPSYTSAGAASCSGAPSTWSGFGGTSISTPTMAAIQALVNQVTGTTWGNPLPVYYQIGQNEYGTAGGTFQGTSCNSSVSGGPAGGCVFNDVTQGDIDSACEYNGTLTEHHCYKPAGTYGVDSTDNVTGATVIWGGSGYTSAPTCTIAGPTNNSPYKTPTGTTLWAGGTQATCTATVSSSTTTAKWTVQMASTSGVGDTIVLTNPSGSTTCGPYTLSGASTTAMCTNLATAIGSGCSLATATCASSTDTITARAAGAAGNFITEFGPATEFDAFYVYITNTVKGQGPNYVSGITIGTAGSGYQPETPITLGGPGTGAIAVANTTPGTAAQSYQPSYGAAPGYDLATGLGTPNATNLVSSCLWYPSPAQGIFSPVANSTLGGNSAVFQWGPYPGATNYWVDIGSTYGGNTYTQSGPLGANACSLTVNSRLPTDGSTVYVTWWYYVGGSWSYTEYQYTAFGGGSQIGVITSPAPNSTLSGSSQLFTWTAGTLSTAYWIDAGSSPGGNQYFQSGNLGNVTSKNVTGLPTDGSTVYVTLWSLVDGQWLNNKYTYTAFSASSCVSTITSPAAGTTLTAYSDTFGWTVSSIPGCSGVVTNYWLDAGTTTSENFFYQSGPLGLVLSGTANNLPPGYGGGQPPPNNQVQMTLWNLIGGTWVASPEVGYCGFGSSGYPACN